MDALLLLFYLAVLVLAVFLVIAQLQLFGIRRAVDELVRRTPPLDSGEHRSGAALFEDPQEAEDRRLRGRKQGALLVCGVLVMLAAIFAFTFFSGSHR